MKKAILFVVMLSLVAFVSVSIAADAPKAATTAPAKAASTAPAPAKMEKFSGEIKSVDPVAKSIVVAGKGKAGEKTFVAADAKITKGKEALKFEDLKAGMKVSVEYKKDMDKMVAGAIKVSVPKAAPKK
ncbi:MAG TPA: hypothetical protein VEM15_13775 [Thermodesulfobacteriota bacterium]|nr:hypothetical protein [Thermodesulfobacteriota bacterium]